MMKPVKRGVNACRTMAIEPLEGRTLMHGAARVYSAYLDNRGTATFTFNEPLKSSSITSKTVGIYTAGKDKKIGTADDVLAKTTASYHGGVLTLSSSAISTNATYRVILKSILDDQGHKLDGEFAGQGTRSGNGTAGGNYDVIANKPKKLVYRMTTVKGFINVAMFTDVATTVGNFATYADDKVWDTTFFHRSTRDSQEPGSIQVIQGGGFGVDASKQIDQRPARAAIPLEVKHSNLKGTIAMARTNDPANPSATSTATNQWFFNVNDNMGLDTLNGGYAVFGKVADKDSQATIEKINALTIRQADPSNSNSPFNELPSLDATGTIDVPKDLALVTRVARVMDLSKPASASAHSIAKAAAPEVVVAAVKRKSYPDVRLADLI